MAKSSFWRTALRAQLFNADARECGNAPAALAILFLVLSSLMAAFPFMLSRYSVCVENGQSSHYPGLGSAWLAVAHEGKGVAFQKGELVKSQHTPEKISFNGWTIAFGKAASEKLTPPYLAFADQRVLIQSGSYAVNGPAAVLDGIDQKGLLKLSQNFDAFTNFVKGSLYALSTVEVPGAFLSIFALMLLQNLIFVLILGMFLAMSGLRIGWQTPDEKRRVGYWPSLKTVACVTAGPGLVAAIFGGVVPQWGMAVAMVAYSLLLGLRVIMVYMSRFKNKPRKR